jgi:large subunit ribosomal protein L24
MASLFIKKNDNVVVLQGKDKGKKAKVLQVFPDEDKVVLEGVNVFKKHQRARKQGQKGQMISVERPLHISNVQLVCATCSKPTRVGHGMNGDKKVRVCKKCQAFIQ